MGEYGATRAVEVLSHADMKGSDSTADVGGKTSGAFQLVNAVGRKA